MCLVTGLAAAQTPIDQDRAATYFREAAALCEREGGRLWGVSLCGPMVFADAATQSVATNQPAPDAKRPSYLGFVNAPVQWGDVRWAAYVWTMIPKDDEQARGRLLVHELFHVVQPELGQWIFETTNDHLETLEGRYYLQMEWRALAQALLADGPERLAAARDALAFRQARRALFPDAAENERAQEIREGLAQYTGTVVSASSPAGAVRDAVQQLKDAQDLETFVKTFGYSSGVAYGLLLDAASPGWTHRFRPEDDLGELLSEAAEILPTENVEDAAARYGGPELWAAETKRAEEREARIAELRRRFVVGPVLVVPRGNGAMLKTTGITPIPGEGRVIFEYRLTAEWGRLESTGILESSDGATLRLPLPFRRTGATLTGDGWTIDLADGWEARPGPRPGDFEIARQDGEAQPR